MCLAAVSSGPDSLSGSALWIWSVATGNQWSGPVRSHDAWFHLSAHVASHCNWSDRRIESESGSGPLEWISCYVKTYTVHLSCNSMHENTHVVCNHVRRMRDLTLCTSAAQNLCVASFIVCGLLWFWFDTARFVHNNENNTVAIC